MSQTTNNKSQTHNTAQHNNNLLLTFFVLFRDGVIVMDNGSSYIKVGVAGHPMPLAVIPTIIGRRWAKSGEKLYALC